MIHKFFSGRLLAIISLIEGAVYLFLWDEAVNLTMSLEYSVLAKIVVGLSLLIILVLTWAIPFFVKNATYRRELLGYNPLHFEEKEFGRWFKYFAKKKDKGR